MSKSGEEPVLQRLRALGYNVSSLAALRHSGTTYATAVPVLVDALTATSDRKTMIELVRTLSVPWASAALEPMIRVFENVYVPPTTALDSLRWSAGNALDVLWSDDHFDELVRLCLDPAYGRDREMIVLGLGRSRRPEAADALIALLDDPAVDGHALKALGQRKEPRARGAAERMRDDRREWVRNTARRVLARLAD